MLQKTIELRKNLQNSEDITEKQAVTNGPMLVYKDAEDEDEDMHDE